MKAALGEVTSLLREHVALENVRYEATESRLENHGTRLGNHDSDLTALRAENTKLKERVSILEMEANKRDERRAPWWTWIAVPGLIIGALSGAIGLWLTLDRIAGAASTFAP